MTFYKASLGVMLVGLLLLGGGQLRANDLVVQDVEWRAPLPGQSVASVYLQLQNTGSETLMLNGIDVDWARKAEFHTHSHEQGMMRMRRVDSLSLAPNEILRMAPGGLHIMVFGVQPWAGSRKLVLVSTSGERIEVTIAEAAP